MIDVTVEPMMSGFKEQTPVLQQTPAQIAIGIMLVKIDFRALVQLYCDQSPRMIMAILLRTKQAVFLIDETHPIHQSTNIIELASRRGYVYALQIALFYALQMQISAKRVGKERKALMKAVESAPRVLFYTLYPENSLTENSATVSMEVKMENEERTNRYGQDWGSLLRTKRWCDQRTVYTARIIFLTMS